MSTSVTLLVHFPFLFLLLLLLTVDSNAQNYKNVSVADSLTAGDANTSWRSPSGHFAFVLRPTFQDNLFLLAIWFDKVPDKTIVWFADNGDNHGDLQIQKGSTVSLDNYGKLILNDPQKNELWSAGSGADSAAMLDNGNFVLGSTSSAEYLWESFNHPTDTILPTQKLQVNSGIYSRETKNSYSKGRFRLRLGEDGYLELNVAAYPSSSESNYDAYYYFSGPFNNDGQKAHYAAVFNQSGYIHVNQGDGTTVLLSNKTILPISEVYYRATLDFDGFFTQYSHPRSKNEEQVWSTVWSVPDDICVAIISRQGSGACGYNIICTPTPERRARCTCPPKFSFVDPNNTYGGCRPDFVQGCQVNEWTTKTDSFELETLENVDWPLSEFEELKYYSLEECRTTCLSDCLCDVAIFRSDTCWKKCWVHALWPNNLGCPLANGGEPISSISFMLPLANGKIDDRMNGVALIKIRKDNLSEPHGYFPQPPDEKNGRSTFILVGSLLLGSSILFNLIFLATACYHNSLAFLVCLTGKKLREKTQDSSVSRSSIRSFTYQELEEATNGFKDELGRGAFGIVYKGLIEEMDSTTFIAVKRLDKVLREGEKEFKTEVSVIGQTHHKNLVRLLGFCDEGQHRLLVYEFMSNSSLANHLFGISKPDWNRRIEIAFGISRGLMYLHEECSTQIIHCDIKPQNILLDDSFTARISDFGLSKLLMTNQTHTCTGIRGTRGYVAPEWFRNAPISAKVDVYSFGVMLLEILCCRKGVLQELGEEEIKDVLTEWAYECFRKGNLEDLIEDGEEVINDMRRFERLVMISIWCIQDEPSLRPSMKKVTQMLEGVLEVNVPPCTYQFKEYVGVGNNSEFNDV
ncbi:hypothetical protein MKX03_011129 [Papaver bracteatum]|nr:hypothetical protein MKX03_011129 [Papaver bracteatum]